MTLKNILIAGGSGFIGWNIVRRLLDLGHNVYILGRKKPAKSYSSDSLNIRHVTWDDLDGKELREIIFDVIINLAGQNVAAGYWSRSQKTRILESRIKATRRLSAFTRELPKFPEVFIQASAVGYYGYKVKEPTDEGGPKGSGFLADVVDEWEKSLDVPDSCRSVIMRLGIVAGNGGAMAKIRATERFGFIGIPGGGNKIQPFIHIDDVVLFIEKSLHDPEFVGIYNLTTPEGKDLRTVLRPLRKLMVPIPDFLFLALFGQMARETLLAEQNIVPSRLLSQGFSYKYSKAEMLVAP